MAEGFRAWGVHLCMGLLSPRLALSWDSWLGLDAQSAGIRGWVFVFARPRDCFICSASSLGIDIFVSDFTSHPSLEILDHLSRLLANIVEKTAVDQGKKILNPNFSRHMTYLEAHAETPNPKPQTLNPKPKTFQGT